MAARDEGASRWCVCAETYLTARGTILLESARVGMICSSPGARRAECYGARDGIGYRIAGWGASLQMPQLYAALAIVAVLAIAVNELLQQIESRIGAWRQRPV